jgi:hypothetical protein
MTRTELFQERDRTERGIAELQALPSNAMRVRLIAQLHDRVRYIEETITRTVAPRVNRLDGSCGCCGMTYGSHTPGCQFAG